MIVVDVREEFFEEKSGTSTFSSLMIKQHMKITARTSLSFIIDDGETWR